MSKKYQRIAWAVVALLFFLPPFLYFVVNGYWWLFDGNQPIADKMVASVIATAFAVWVLSAWAAIGELFND